MVRPKCGAKLRRKPGRTCQSEYVMVNGRCRIHGGKSTGPKTLTAGGRYSHGLGALAARFDELLQVDNLLDLGQTMALQDLATNLRLERGLTAGDTVLFRKVAREKLAAVYTAIQLDNGTMRWTLDELRAHLEAGARADQAVAEAVEIANQRSQRAERALQIGLASEKAVSEQQLQLLLALLARVVADNVTPEAFAKVRAGWRTEAARMAQRTRLPAGLLAEPETVDVAPSV